MEKSNMYSRGKIYKIVSPSHPELVYYGSTCNELYKRLSCHKAPSNNTNSKLIMCYDDVCIVLVENFSCNSRNELYAKEYEYILSNKCVNRLGRGFDQKEYTKDYYAANKDKIKECVSQKIICECGRTVIKNHLARHRKSAFHLKKTSHVDTSIEV